MSTLTKFLLASLLFAAGSSRAEPASQAYAPVPPDPAYSDVTALPYRPHDRKITYGDHPDQVGLLWLPDTPPPFNSPTIVLVHGGCWLNAYDIDHSRALATALARAGYPVWNLEYRRADTTVSSWPTSLEDLQRGLLAIEALEDFGVTNNQVIILGHSAGGHLGLLLGASAKTVFPTVQPTLSVVGLAAITDIARYAEGGSSCQKAAALFMGALPEAAPAAYAAANPAKMGISVAVTLLHGDNDQIVPRAQFEGLRGDNVTGIIEPGAGHFDWIHPGTPAFQTLLQTLGRLTYDNN